MRTLIAVLVAVSVLVGCRVEPVAVQSVERHVDAGASDLAPSSPVLACGPAGFPTKWDSAIEQASSRYLPHVWREVAPCGLRAQLAAESGLNDKWCTDANPHGTSAACLGQITRSAAQDIERRSGIHSSRTNPQASIRAAAFYLAAQRSFWTEPRTPSCRRVLSVASYHGGAGTLVEAQRAARRAGHVARCYDGLKDYLPRYGDENRHYIKRVETLRQRMAQ